MSVWWQSIAHRDLAIVYAVVVVVICCDIRWPTSLKLFGNTHFQAFSINFNRLHIMSQVGRHSCLSAINAAEYK